MIAQLDIEKIAPTQQTIELGKVTLMLPIEVDPKPYIREILRVDLESITHPKARECLEFGLQDATTDADFSSLIESFYLCRSHANAERLFAALRTDEEPTHVVQTVDELRKQWSMS
jgi:hypothetical protein